MNNLESDLEEGEIVDDDDTPPSPKFNINKKKELPRRYILSDNKNSPHKHKKGCRHAVRYHAKKLSKLKKSPTKMKVIPKQYHKPSCIHEKYHNVPGRHDSSDTLKNVFPKNSYFSQNSLISEMKGSLKNASPFNKRSTDLERVKSHNIPFPKQNFKTPENNFAATEISSAKMQENNVDNFVSNDISTKSDYLPEKTSDSNQHVIDLSKSPDISDIIELKSDDDRKDIDNAVSNNSLQDKDEESEDEEELRRLALATCAKRKAAEESENMIQNIENISPCKIPVPDLSNVNIQVSHQEEKNPTTDNYEVVDMEVDEETPNSVEIVQTSVTDQKSESAEDLFVIDTNPSNDFVQEMKNSFAEPQKTCNSSDEEFEVNILRAELINSMYRKKLLQEDSKQESNNAIHESIPVMQQKKPLVNYQSPNLMFRNKRLKSAKHFLRKRSVNKSESMKNNKIVLPVQANKPPERLIITVNEESSDDSDSSGEETNTVTENPVDSIVALISDCRQKSKSNTETKEKETVPKAVSCLSKAQQEEYNSLMKILAKKKKLLSVQETLPPKNGSIRTPLDDFKKLEEKLGVLRSALKNKKESMSLLSKDVNSKKQHYMKAKLTAQHLKEQLIAADKIRKARLVEWLKTCDNLKSMKKSVSDLENKIYEVQNLCSKIGSSLQGQSYKLSLLSGSKES